MRIETSNLPVAFATIIPIKAASFEEKTRDGIPVLSPDGRKTYRARVSALALGENGAPTREENNFSVAVILPSDVNPGVLYQVSGRVWITHYVTSTNRLGVSIVAEKLVPFGVEK